MSIELLVAVIAALLALAALLGNVLLLRRLRRDRAQVRVVARRLAKLQDRIAKQRERHRRLHERLVEVAKEEAGASRVAASNVSKADDSHRLATETARAIEYVLTDVIELRRDLDALERAGL